METKMKNSTKFWLIVLALSTITYNIFWYNYVFRYCNATHILTEEVLVSAYGTCINGAVSLFLIIYFVPKFNKWLNKNQK